MSPSILLWGLAAVALWWYSGDGVSNEDSKREAAKLEAVKSELEATADDEKDIESEESGIHTLNVNHVDSPAVPETISIEEDAIQEVIPESNHVGEKTLSLINQKFDQPMELTENEVTQESISDAAGSSNCSTTSSSSCNSSSKILNHSLFTVYDISSTGCKIRRDVSWVQIQSKNDFGTMGDHERKQSRLLNDRHLKLSSPSTSSSSRSPAVSQVSSSSSNSSDDLCQYQKATPDHHRIPKKTTLSSTKTAHPSTPYKVISFKKRVIADTVQTTTSSIKKKLSSDASSTKGKLNPPMMQVIRSSTGGKGSRNQLFPCKATSEESRGNDHLTGYSKVKKEGQARVSESNKKQQERSRQNYMEKKSREEELMKQQAHISVRKKHLEEKKKQCLAKARDSGGGTQHRKMWHV